MFAKNMDDTYVFACVYLQVYNRKWQHNQLTELYAKRKYDFSFWFCCDEIKET